VSNQNDIIELNGYKYDAKTGAMLGKADTYQTPSLPKSIDGFNRRSRNQPVKTLSSKKPSPSQNVHQKTSRSKTLMRHTVKKPDTQKSTDQIESPLQKRTLAPTPQRIERANQSNLSPHVSKFSSASTTVAPMKVREAPSPQAAPIKAEEKRALLPLSPFDMALQNAKSHEQKHINSTSFRKKITKRLRVSPRAASITAGIAVMIFGGIFFANQYMPSLSVRLAAARAGVEAQIPGYRPSGFSLSGPIEYSTGQITLQYQSNSDDRSFRVVQKKTDWNSQSLLDNFIAAEDKSFQTFQDKGKTIYIYDGNNATWVSGGVWYQVEGEASLNSDQLLRIANGL